MQIDNNSNSSARQRLAYLFDDGEYTEINSFVKEKDSAAGVITAYGYVNGSLVYAFSQDKTINSGAVGMAHADKIVKLYAMAEKTGKPIVAVHDSNGAFVDGTVESMTAYGKMLASASRLSGVVPQIAVIAGVCAGSAALLACSADFVIMTEESEFFVAPPFDSKTDGAGTASAAAKSGTASLVCEDDEAAMAAAKELLRLLPENNLSPLPVFEYEDSSIAASASILDTVKAIADEDTITELYAGYGKASYTAIASLNGSAVGIAATGNGSDKLTGDDCSKLARFVRTCDAFAIPVITIINTEGFAEDGSIKDMTKLANSYAEATCAKLALITGKAYGAAFVAFCGGNTNADLTYAWENAVISPFAPLTAAEFLWHDKLKGTSDVTAARNELADEYARTLGSAVSAAEKGCIDEIIDAAETKAKLASALEILAGKRVAKLPKKHNNIPF